jgi:type IV pilus assembly protein PilX
MTVRASHQRGASLIIVLLLLTVMIGLGTTALRTAEVNARVSGNERDRQLAFEAAEAALRDGESWIRITPPPATDFSVSCSQGLCLPSTTGTPQWRQVEWIGTAPINYGHGSGEYPQAGLVRAPRYIVEILPAIASGTPYRITATGWGRSPGGEVRLQSVYVSGGFGPARRLSWRQER